MPELPDVEVLRRYFDSTALHKKIKAVEAEKTVLEGLSPGKLASELEGKTFDKTKRHGKNLFAGIDSHRFLVFHFGMTGFLKYFLNGEEKPGHVRMQVSFENGYHLAFDCQRKLGRIRLIDDYEAFLEEKGLGPDALADSMTADLFRNRLTRGGGAVKSTLMNQSIIAGIGNVYADEILYQARLHPKRKVSDLGEQEIEILYNAMRYVLDKAIAGNAEPEKMPDDFLLPLRGTDASCPCGGKLEKIKVSGRNGYFCPHCQK